MHLLLGKGWLSPPKIADNLCAMSKGFVAPESHHTGVWIWVIRRPVYRSRLLFHHPPTSIGSATAGPFCATGPIEIVMEGLKVRVTGPHVPVFPSVIASKLFQKPNRV